MMKELKEAKATIRDFMRDQYTDERLVMLLDHARAGHLRYNSCCCFVGIVTAVHKLRHREGIAATHGTLFMDVRGGTEASAAFYALGYVGALSLRTTDEMRRARLIPMILAEIRRRRHAINVKQAWKITVIQ